MNYFVIVLPLIYSVGGRKGQKFMGHSEPGPLFTSPSAIDQLLPYEFMSIRSCSSTISSTFTSLLGNMNSTAMVMVMFSIAILAILPGVKILLFFTDLYPDLPPQSTIIQHLHYLVMAIIIPVLGIAGVMVYADIAFPLVTYIFAMILNLTSQNNLRIRVKCNVDSTK